MIASTIRLALVFCVSFHVNMPVDVSNVLSVRFVDQMNDVYFFVVNIVGFLPKSGYILYIYIQGEHSQPEPAIVCAAMPVRYDSHSGWKCSLGICEQYSSGLLNLNLMNFNFSFMLSNKNS